MYKKSSLKITILVVCYKNLAFLTYSKAFLRHFYSSKNSSKNRVKIPENSFEKKNQRTSYSKSVGTFMNFGKLGPTRKRALFDQTKIMFYAMGLLLIYVVLHSYGEVQNLFKIALNTTT